jgi:hypothetical protein
VGHGPAEPDHVPAPEGGAPMTHDIIDVDAELVIVLRVPRH